MKHFICIISIFLFSVSAKAQIKDLPIYYDQEITTTFIDSLSVLKVNEIVIFQTDKKFQFLESEDSVITFICWKNKGVYQVQIITSDKMYSPVSFNGEKIFGFKNKLETLATADEKALRPSPTNLNAVYYYSGKAKGYFEQADHLNSAPSTYKTEDQTKEKLRTEWFQIIYKTLYDENFNFKIKSNYHRKL